MTKLLNRIEELEKYEPWTNSELRTFNRNIRFFIRGVQIQDGKSKGEAIAFYRHYMSDMPKTERQIYAKKVHKTLTSYPKKVKKGKSGKRELMREAPLVMYDEDKAREKNEPIEDEKEHKFSSKFTDFNDWFKNSTASEKTRNRIIKNYQQKPNVSLKQLYGKKGK